jgi:hypothetical protein
MSEVGLLSSLYAVPTVATVTMTSREAGRGVGTEDTIQRYKKTRDIRPPMRTTLFFNLESSHSALRPKNA